VNADPKSFGAVPSEELYADPRRFHEAVLRVVFLRGLRVLRVKSIAQRCLPRSSPNPTSSRLAVTRSP